MRKFRNNVSDGWLFKQELRMWRNFARNWDRDVEDCDFFDPFANTANASEEDAKTILAQAFPLDELEKIDAIKFHRGADKSKKEFELHGDVDGILRDIWNHKGWRDECRSMLTAWCDRMEKRKTRKCRKSDPLVLRMD